MAKAINRDLSYLQRPDCKGLDHIPGELGWPIIGKTFELVFNTYPFIDSLYKTYGPVIKLRSIGQYGLLCLGADINQQIYLDPEG